MKDVIRVDVKAGKSEEGLWCNVELLPQCSLHLEPALQGVQPGNGYTTQFIDTSVLNYTHNVSFVLSDRRVRRKRRLMLLFLLTIQIMFEKIAFGRQYKYIFV